MRRGRAALLAALIGAAGPTLPATGAEVAPCVLGGPAGTSSVLRVDLPRGSASLALRVTTPSAAAATSPQTVGSRGSWHLATQIALLRARTGELVAHRAVQAGSSPRAVAVTAAGTDNRVAVPAGVAPFRHVGASVPPYLPPGSYLLVAYGTDGSTALPNPGWSAEAAFGVPVTCVPLRVGTALLDRDQSGFTGGTQATAYGAGTGSGTQTSWRLRQRYVVGFADAATQLAGDARVRGTLPGGRRVDAHNALRPFAGGPGTYRFTADWTGPFPVVLVCALAFTA